MKKLRLLLVIPVTLLAGCSVQIIPTNQSILNKEKAGASQKNIQQDISASKKVNTLMAGYIKG